MNTALLVIGNGRLDYLHEAVDDGLYYLPAVNHHLMVDDSGDPNIAAELNHRYPDWQHTHHPANRGMAAAVQTGFDMVLNTDADYVFWLEEDMLLTRPIPLDDAINQLEQHGNIAQMLFQRQPLTIDEHELGGVSQCLWRLSSSPTRHAGWIEQDYIFSLNPCVIPRRVLQLGWDRDNEAGMTRKLHDHGYKFGVWDGEHVRHIGAERGAAWQL